jgi:hypothetical protein
LPTGINRDSMGFNGMSRDFVLKIGKYRGKTDD